MIRLATADDMDALLEMGRNFVAATVEDSMGFDAESLKGTMLALIDSDDGALFVAEGDGLIGMIGGILYPAYFNKGQKTGQELFWWVEPQSRGGKDAVQLMRALMQWAQEAGAGTFSMLSIEPLRIDSVERLYLRNGFKPLERTYMKVLN